MGDDIKPLLVVLSTGLKFLYLYLRHNSFRLSESLPIISPSPPLYVALLANVAIEGMYPFDTSMVRVSMRVTHWRYVGYCYRLEGSKNQIE